MTVLFNLLLVGFLQRIDVSVSLPIVRQVSESVMTTVAVDLRLGFLLEFRAIPVQHLVGIVVCGEEADIVHLGPAPLLGAQGGCPSPQQGLECRRSEIRHLKTAALKEQRKKVNTWEEVRPVELIGTSVDYIINA